MPHQQQPQGLHLGKAVSIFSETALNKAQSTQQPTRMLPDHSPLRKAERTMGFPAVSAEMTMKLSKEESGHSRPTTIACHIAFQGQQ